jgi:hypothetical protein
MEIVYRLESRLVLAEALPAMEKPYYCQKCGPICVEKDNFLIDSLEGKYEGLCGKCAREEGFLTPLKWKPG